MPAALTRRATALLAVLLLLFPSVGEALGHGCPHHGALPAGAEAAEHGSHDRDSAPAQHEGPCTCEGMCQAGSLPGLPAGPADLVPAGSSAAERPASPRGQGRVRFPAFFLPYAQGPPPAR